ncbi:polysaccharide pyruvyl transferase family protein [Salmonella enterica subsp. enterica serovar Virchow]|nr:polysaccharide pyruvyl transferase family protein [Salmonella enterica subsp. enterica serovar Virchow]EBX4816735.1 polysaccharide pyruvyl transferase family protein [Salmonella enterica subsp. enterica serovar Newport]ECD4520207.1 polysaccharide pyruvyl transferase family protein [Salmonella enterica subsp. enterica serovar Virchow]MIL09627.1 polysaccharide pyruvyl transferase family protein [Salmonella enterica subsp. enterica serovar Enteritidis]
MRRIKVFAASVGSAFGRQAENYGDNLMTPLLRELFNVEPLFVKMGQAELIGIGSILDAYDRRRKPAWKRFVAGVGRPALHAWGSGFMNSDGAAIWPQALKVHAVRGPLSAGKIGQRGLALGDPALLLPLIWQKPQRATAEVALVPHFATYTDFVARWSTALPAHWTIVDLLGDPEAITAQIAGADLVASSSLHGLIIADAYDTPSVRLVGDGKIKGDGFKYNDYEGFRGAPLLDAVTPEALLAGAYTANAPRPMSEQARDALLAAFPFR